MVVTHNAFLGLDVVLSFRNISQIINDQRCTKNLVNMAGDTQKIGAGLKFRSLSSTIRLKSGVMPT